MRYTTIAVTLGLLTLVGIGFALHHPSEAVLMTEATQIATFAAV